MKHLEISRLDIGTQVSFELEEISGIDEYLERPKSFKNPEIERYLSPEIPPRWMAVSKRIKNEHSIDGILCSVDIRRYNFVLLVQLSYLVDKC